MTILRCSFLKAVSFLIAAIMLTILFGGNSGSAQTYDAIRDIHYYMMDKNESRELPAVSGRTYLSSDDKIAVIAGNTLKAVADGDCVIEMITGGKKSVFARLAVGWQVQNPVLPYSWGLHIDDSEVHNFNGQMYAYGCMEGFVPKRYASPYYPSLTTRDMKHWESYGYSYSSFDEGSPYPGRILWDADGCFYKGKYLLYGFFEWNASGKDNNSFVMESDSPTGRFKNLRWLIGDKSGEKIDGISAQIFIDSDDSRYILYSPTKNRVEENYIVVARLKDDHIIDEASRKNLGHINDYYENPSLRKHGDMYYLLFAENCGAITNKNHTPKRLSYATSKNIFGPYTYRGVIITVEHLVGNSNIQGCMEPFGDNWYLFYHRSLNAVWNQRTMCIEKIEFDKNGLIKPVVPTSSGISEGLNTSKPIYFNTAVIEKNCRYSNEGKYGSAIIKDNAEIGFRYVSLTGKEKKISLQGKGLNNITTITVTANGKIIGQGIGGQDIKLENIGEGKTELVFNITSNGEVKLETFRFFDYMTDKNDSRELPAAPAVYNGTSKDKPVFRWQKQNGVQCLLTENNTVAGRLSGETSNGVNVVSEKIVELDSTTFQITRQYKAVKDVDSARVCFDFVHASPSAYWMIPAVSYNGNRFGRGKEPKNAAENGVWRSFSFRRTPIPGITYSEGKQFAVAVWSDNPQRECDNFACSLMPEEQTTTHRIILPEEEMPTNYTKVNGSKTGFQKQMAMKKGETLTLTMYVNVNAVEKNHTAVRHFLDKAWAMAAKPKIAIPDADKIWNLAIRYAKESLWKETEKDGKKFSGFDIGLHPDKNGKWIMYQNTYQAGWVGRNIPLANALLADFLRNGNEDSKNKGLKVLDSWAEHCVLPNGLMLVTFRGFPDRSRLQQIDANNLGGVAGDFFEAADLAKQAGVDGQRYEKVAYGICDFIKNDQQPDGQYARGWTSDGKATLREGTICATVLPAMITAYRHSQDASYLQSAIKGYEFYMQEFHRDGYTTAGALDTWCIDKESACPLLTAAIRLYEDTGKRQYLDDAVSLSYYLSQWLWHYQGVYPAEDDFTKYGFSTFGATSVSVQHHCLDEFGQFWIADWVRLSELTNDPQWKDKALAIWRNCQQLIGDGERTIHGLTFPAGSQSESFFHCNYWIGHETHNKENERINSWCPAWIGAGRLEVLRKLGSIFK